MKGAVGIVDTLFTNNALSHSSNYLKSIAISVPRHNGIIDGYENEESTQDEYPDDR